MAIFFLHLLILYFSNLFRYSYSFCGIHLHSTATQNQLIKNKTLNSKRNNIYNNKRQLSTEYTELKIIIDNQYLLYQLQNNIISEKKYELIFNSLNAATSMLSSLIVIEKNNNHISLDKDEILEKCHLGEFFYKEEYLSPNEISSDSIIVYPRFHNYNQNGKNNILASAKYCYLDEDSKRPLAGFIYIEQNITEIEMRKINIDKYYTMIFLHELTHILIFDESLFELNNNIEIKEIEILQQTRKIISSPKVLEMAKRHFACKTLKGIELENQEYDWKKDEDNEENHYYNKYSNHWDARTMLTDYMTSIHYDEVVISEITLALFEDSGWYKVNYYTGGLFRYGKNQGCDFLTSYCVYGDISLHKNEFCITEKATMCTPGRTHRAMCGLTTYPNELNKFYRYFTNSRKGGYLPQTDYCPVAKTNSSISKTYFYQGHCSYGEIELFPETLKYSMGENSICLLSSLTPKNDESLKEYPSSFRALCYKIDCYSNSGEKAVRIYIGNNVIICPVSGGVQTLEGYNGFILCPDYNLICTGTKWCSDPISCVEKQSEPLSESYDYDYKSSTSQEYQDLLNYKVPHEDKITLYGIHLYFKNFFIFFIFLNIFIF